MLKKLLSILLSATICLAPIGQLQLKASDSVVKNTTTFTEYSNWSDAIAAVTDGQTLTALCDCGDAITIPEGSNVTIDFGDYKYTRGMTINGTLTVLGGTFIAGNAGSSAETWDNYGTVNIKGGSFNSKVWDVASHQSWGFSVCNYGTFNISAGTFNGEGSIMAKSAKVGDTYVYGNTYITGGSFLPDSLGSMNFSNGNIYETDQHFYISKGTFANERKTLILSLLSADAAVSAVDLGDGTFSLMTAAEKVAYEESLKCKHTNTELRNAKSATCAATGYSGDKYCKDCGELLEAGSDIPATGNHTWDAGTVTKAATTSEEGVKTYTCTVCGTTKTEAIAKLDLTVPVDSVSDASEGQAVNTTDTKATYVATDDGTVAYSGTTKKAKSAKVPDTVTDASGNKVKVTEISSDAFAGNSKVKKVEIGKNVTTIDSGAFSKCKNLKTITVNAKKAITVEKGAFKGTDTKKMTIKVSSKMSSKELKKFKKNLKKAGFKGKVTK